MNMTLSPKVNNAYKFLTRLASNKQPGEKMPPVQELRKQLSVSQVTIQNACDLLEAQGIIVRKRREGIFVSDKLDAGEFAIIAKPELFNPERHPYFPLATKILTEEIQNHNNNCTIKLHMGKYTSSAREFPNSLDLNEPQVLAGIRGVFSFAPLYELEDKLKQAHVPVIGLGTDRSSDKDLENSVSFESWDKVLYKAVDYLAKAGCKSIGMAWARPGFRNIDPHEDCEAILVSICKQFGIKYNAPWMKPIVLLDQQALEEEHGAEFLRNVWGLTDRPEAIISLDEIASRGILYEMANMGISIPNDIKLISQATKGIKLPYPRPVTRIEFDPEKQIQVGLEMMLKLIVGNTPEVKQIKVPSTLVKGETG